MIIYDKETADWFTKNYDSATTVVSCTYCGLFYKEDLGHICRKKRREIDLLLDHEKGKRND